MFKRLLATATIVFALTTAAQETKGKIMLVIHGGAGTINRKSMSEEREHEYRAALEQALKTGQAVLMKGGSSLDAVEAAVRFMEDSPLFNAGKGAVFTHEGKNELDAAIMDGRNKMAGSVAGVTIIKNPITAARAVMEKSKHVMMAGRGAELFATKMGLEIVDPSYFWTERRWKGLQEELLKEQKPQAGLITADENRFGTVGAVALDQSGNLAAATSTGGTTNKQYGRIGDSPIIGAGTYADNATCAVSATGTGEYFIRWTVAHEISALMKYRGLSVQQAADEVINKILKAVPGADGGVIALDAKGNFAMPFNTEGMYRGWIGGDGVAHVAIYGD
jgi:beta-aspartyl-peptidase (threonine type)